MIDHFLAIMFMFVAMIMSPLKYVFPLNQKKLLFMIMINIIMIVFMIVMLLVGTKTERP